jgi:hypothetical protein
MFSIFNNTIIPSNQKYKMQNSDRTAMTCNMRYSNSCKLIKHTKVYKKCLFFAHPYTIHEKYQTDTTIA